VRPALADWVTLTEYHKDFPCPVAYPPESLENGLGEYVSSLGMRQLRIAETEKYAHVTFFLNGGREVEFDGEDRVLVPSPKVATYDLKPEMSAPELTDRLCEAIRSGVNTVPIGQAEAARAIGLPFLAAARLVILPQAFRGAVAPLGNVMIALIKNTTVAAAASVATETSSVMRTMIEFNSSYIYAIFFTFAIGYVILVTPVGLAATYLSQRLAVRR
jgi:hypothetical protein